MKHPILEIDDDNTLPALVKRLSGIIEKVPDFKPAVYVDVDSTLIGPGGGLIHKTIKLVKGLRFALGTNIQIFVWSTGGQKYAEDARIESGLKDYTDGALCKPFVIVDDLCELFMCNSEQYVTPWKAPVILDKGSEV